MFSFSNTTAMPSSLRARTYPRQSTVLRAKREMDLTSMRSIFLCLHLRIILRNSGRLAVEVPVIPSSAKMPAIVQLGFFMIISV